MGDVVLEVPFTGGVDQSTRNEVLSPSAAYTSLTNTRQSTIGGVAKRPGFAALSNTRLDASSRTVGRRIVANDKLVSVIDGTTLDTWNESLGRWISHGRVPEATFQSISTPSLGGSFASVEDSVVVRGFVVIVALVVLDPAHWGMSAVVVDPTTGAVVHGPVKLDTTTPPAGLTGTSVRVACYGSYAIAFIGDASVGEVRSYYLDLSTAASITAGWQTLATFADYNTTPTHAGLDVGCTFSNDHVIIAYQNLSGGTNRITVTSLTKSGLVASTTIATVSVVPFGNQLGISEGSDTLWLSWKDATNNKIKALGLNPTTLAVSSTVLDVYNSSFTMFSVHVEARAGTKLATVYGSGFLDANSRFGCVIQGIKDNGSGATVVDGHDVPMTGARLNSRPFLHNGRMYAHAANGTQSGYPLCDITHPIQAGAFEHYFRPVALPVIRGLSVASQTVRARTSPLSGITGTTFAHATNQLAEGNAASSALFSYDFADPRRWRPAQRGDLTYLSGGICSIFDGARVFESNFICCPDLPSTDNSGGSGLDMTNGRVYVAVYEETDAAGNRHLSGVSEPCAISGAQTNKACVVSVSPLAITSRALSGAGVSSSITIKVTFYATLDSNIGAPPFYRLGEALNNTLSSVLTFSDTTPDGVLSASELLYGEGSLPATNGSSQDHRAPVGLNYIVSYNGMIVGAADNVIYFSSQPIDGEGQWFSPIFTVPIDDRVTALVVLDSSLIIFAESHIYTVSGDPPADNFSSGGIGIPSRLSVDVGSLDGMVVSTSAGIFFRSDRGIQLLTRGLSVQYIGAGVQDELASFPIVTAMTRDTRNNLVRISLAATEDSTGLVIGTGRDVVFDLVLSKWISSDRKTGISADQPSQDSAMVFSGGGWFYGWLASDGTMYTERPKTDASACLDGSTWTTQGAMTSWVHVAGLQGEQFIDQLLLLAKKSTDHDLTISIAYDYSDSFTESQTFTAAELTSLAREWLVRGLTQTTSNAVRVQLTDATPSSGTVGTGAGGTWVCLTFSGQPHRGPKRSSAAQRGG